MEEYKIYKMTFPNGKIYIGQTKQEICKRWHASYYRYNKEMYNDIVLFGWENIIKEVIEIVNTKEEALNREEYYISFYDTTNKLKGYNKAYRASGIKKTSLEEVLKKWEEGKTVHQIAEELERSRSLIAILLTRAGVDPHERHLRSFESRKKKVSQYSIKGEYIATYESLKEAERQTGVSNRNISLCCRDKMKTTGGYIWKYED